MKRNICLSIAILLTFYFCKNLSGMLSYFEVTFSSREVGITLIWAAIALIIATASAVLYGIRNTASSLGLSKNILTGIGYGLFMTLPMIIGYSVIGDLRVDMLVFSSILGILFWAGMEEVFYRGFLFGQLFQKAKWGFLPAVLLNAVIFGMGHLYQGNGFGQTAGIFTVTLMGAIWFSWIYIEWESNLWVAISLHAFMNLSWTMSSVGENALGGWGANLFRVITIVLSVVLTIAYRKQKGHFRVNKSNFFFQKSKSLASQNTTPVTEKSKFQVVSNILLLLIFCSQLNAQTTISGILSEKTAGTKLSYANIGIVNTTTGTVSDENGDFTLYLNESQGLNDSLRISLIGYKSQTFRIGEIESPMEVQLEKEVFDLAEVVVKPKFSNTKVAGRRKANGRMNVNFSISKKPRQNLGAEIGKRFKIKKRRTTQVESLRFYIRANGFEEVKFRVLFYEVKRGKPGKFLTDEDIIVTVKNKQIGWIEVDLSQYEIITKKNFIVTLQWIDASEEGRSLAMPIKMPLFGSHHYYRFGSQAKWKHFRNMSATMNVTLAY